MLDQAAAARVMIFARRSGPAKALAVLRDKLGAERMKSRITDRRRCRDDEFPIGRLPGAQLGWALQEVRFFLRREWAHFPEAGIEAVLLMLVKLPGDLDEITAPHRVAVFVIWIVAPDAQRHAIAGVGQGEFAIRFLFASEFRRDSIELHVHARLKRSLRDGLADFLERH